MSEVATTTVTPDAVAAPAPATPPTVRGTIHDAVDALFANKDTATPVAETKPITEAPKVADGETAPAEGETPTAPPETPAVSKVGAADYALQLAKAKKKLVKQASKVPTAAEPAPSPDVIKRALAIQAAGGDPLKALEAAGLDLAAVVQAHENRRATDPEYADPLAKAFKQLEERLASYEKREDAAKEVAAVSSFFADAEKLIASGGDKFEYVAAEGSDGLELVKWLVLEAANGTEDEPPRTMPLPEALQRAEEHYIEQIAKKAKTKKFAAQFAAAPPKTLAPGITAAAPHAGAAPVKPTTPLTAKDVIANEIDALLG